MSYVSPYLLRPLRDLDEVQKAAPVRAGRPGRRIPATDTRRSLFYPGDWTTLITYRNHPDLSRRVQVVRNLDTFNVLVRGVGGLARRVAASELREIDR